MSRRNKPRAVGGEANLAERIKRERVKREWSPADLADQLTAVGCSISTSAIYRIEGGDPPRRIAVDELISLGQVFGTTVDDLLTPVEVLDQQRAQHLLAALDEADELLSVAISRVLQGYVDLFELATHEKELYDYVHGHRFREPGIAGDDAASLFAMVDDQGEVLDVPDSTVREAVLAFYPQLVKQAREVAEVVVTRTKERNATK